MAELPLAGSTLGAARPDPEVEAALADLRGRGDETVNRLLRKNEPHWRSLSELDRGTVDLLAHTIASRLLDLPAARLAGEQGVAARDGYVRALRELFALGRGRRSR